MVFETKKQNSATMPAADRQTQKDWLLQKERELRLPKHNQFMDNETREYHINKAIRERKEQEDKQKKREQEEQEMHENSRRWKEKMGMM